MSRWTLWMVVVPTIAALIYLVCVCGFAGLVLYRLLYGW